MPYHYKSDPIASNVIRLLSCTGGNGGAVLAGPDGHVLGTEPQMQKRPNVRGCVANLSAVYISSMDRPKIFRYAKFELDALLTFVEKLRNRPCHCDTTAPPMSGSMNWAVVVAFNDGVEWIFRSPRPSALSDEYAARVLASEVATLNYIRTHSSVPVPEVFAYR